MAGIKNIEYGLMRIDTLQALYDTVHKYEILYAVIDPVTRQCVNVTGWGKPTYSNNYIRVDRNTFITCLGCVFIGGKWYHPIYNKEYLEKLGYHINIVEQGFRHHSSGVRYTSVEEEVIDKIDLLIDILPQIVGLVKKG